MDSPICRDQSVCAALQRAHRSQVSEDKWNVLTKDVKESQQREHAVSVFAFDLCKTLPESNKFNVNNAVGR